MDFSKRQKQILDRLRPKPLHHGQLETELIAVPDLKLEDIAPERWQILRDSFIQEGSNLIPLIVRRTEAYNDEEYEVIYGADWCLVAKELDIERLWVWVFDLDDEQAAVTQTEMELLFGGLETPAPTPDVIKQMSTLFQRQESSLEKKISQQMSEAIEQQLPKLLKQQLGGLETPAPTPDVIKQMSTLVQGLEQSLEKISQHSEMMNRAIAELKKIAPPRRGSSYENMNLTQLREFAKDHELEFYNMNLTQLKELAKDLEGFSNNLREAGLMKLLIKAYQQASH